MRRTKVVALWISASLIFGVVLFTIFPPALAFDDTRTKPIILYYDFENLPFTPAQFPQIVNVTLAHHFNTLMLLVYYEHQQIFNKSTVKHFLDYSKSKNLTLVPSYYLESLADRINVSGFSWINLDMERFSPNNQRLYYEKISLQNVPRISVTSPYGQPLEFNTPLDIVESYAGSYLFWWMQLSYLHYSHICSVAVWMLRSQQAYEDQKNYCQRYSMGVMVFDYYNLLQSGFQ